jgi:hypothetical protein
MTPTEPIREGDGRAVFSEGLMLLLSFVTMALGVAADHGHYSPRALAWVGASTVCLVIAARQYRAGKVRSVMAPEKLLAGTLVLLLLTGLLDQPGIYLQTSVYGRVYFAGQLGLALAVGAGFLWPRSGDRWRGAVFAAGLVLGFGLRIGMVLASPAPQIDVFTQFQESAAHLLHGLNPFLTPITEPPPGAATFGYHVTGYAYPPASLYAQTLFYSLFGDIRYAHIASELIAVAGLYAIVPKARRASGQLLVLLFLFHPRGFFVIEQAWNEPLLVGCAGIFLWLAVTRPASRWVPVVFGVFLSLKQYLVFFAALFFLRPKLWRWLPLVSVVVLATWLPFLVWDAPSGLQNGLLFQFRTPFRPDGLTISAALFRCCGWAATKWVAIAVGVATTAFTHLLLNGRSLGGYLYASVLTTLAVFLSGSQAFCNYYYFLGAMLLFLVAIRLREEVSHAN